MTGILSMKLEDEERLNPHALSRFNDWQARILSKAPQLRQLNIEQIEADLDTYLNDSERAEFNKCLADIVEWLSKCMDTGEGYCAYAYATWVIAPMFRVEWLISRAYQRAEAEQRKKEAEKRWQLAYEAVNPPVSDMEKYLNNEERDAFVRAARQAIFVYTEKGEGYLNDPRSSDYRWYLERIRDRKEKERQLLLATLAAQEFNRRLSEEKSRLQALLSPNRKDTESYFKKRVKDRRYSGQSFSQLLTKKEGEVFDRTLVEMSRKKVEELVSTDFRPFIASECWRSFFLLPSADYILEEIPCLTFMFDVFAVVETGVWLKPGQKKFNGYVFDLPWREEKGNFGSITKPDLLGYHHLVLTSEDLGCSSWQTIPLILLEGLLRGETRPSGTVIISASDDDITYEVEGFEEEVEIPSKFAEYLKTIGSFGGMVSTGIVSEMIADIIEGEQAKPKKGLSTPSVGVSAVGKDTSKAKAFQLFNQGKRPGDPEVKALDIKPSTAYRYYQEWRGTHHHSQS